ncbi:MAG: radical SAM protein [Euryarchaeota archaeon]|nr:radical SAM protein [Euryarchaeota archaeon]
MPMPETKYEHGYRYVPFITLSLTEPKARIWITLSGCNFKCKGCFSIARDTVGEPMTVDGLINWVKKSSRAYNGNTLLQDAVITGGEPTLDKDFLMDLVLNLKMRIEVKHITLSTNGYLLDRRYVMELKDIGLDVVKLDIKAYNESIHQWYTSMSNRPVLKAARYLWESKLDFRVETVLMPEIVDVEEIERIASFLAQIDPEIKYKVIKFAPGEAREKVARRPSDDEIKLAVDSASKYLRNVAGGKACVQQFASPRSREEEAKKWVRVYPDMKTETIIAKPGGFEVS